MKEKYCMISADAEAAFDKIQQFFITLKKKFDKLKGNLT